MNFTSQKCIPRGATLGKQVMARTCAVRYSALSTYSPAKAIRWRGEGGNLKALFKAEGNYSGPSAFFLHICVFVNISESVPKRAIVLSVLFCYCCCRDNTSWNVDQWLKFQRLGLDFLKSWRRFMATAYACKSHREEWHWAFEYISSDDHDASCAPQMGM